MLRKGKEGQEEGNGEGDGENIICTVVEEGRSDGQQERKERKTGNAFIPSRPSSKIHKRKTSLLPASTSLCALATHIPPRAKTQQLKKQTPFASSFYLLVTAATFLSRAVLRPRLVGARLFTPIFLSFSSHSSLFLLVLPHPVPPSPLFFCLL